MLVHQLLIFCIALFLGSTIAAPVPHSQLDEVNVFSREPVGGLQRFKHAAQAVSTINKVQKGFHPKAGEAVFWSGTRTGAGGTRVSVHGDAQKFAHDHGKLTINHGLAQKGIKIPDRHENPHSDHIWNVASKIWAERASGHTHAILGGAVRPQSVYNTIEKPILMKNPHVTKLTEHNMETGQSVVVKG